MDKLKLTLIDMGDSTYRAEHAHKTLFAGLHGVSQPDAAELVRRYNAFPRLAELAGIIARNRTTSEAEGEDLGNDDAMDGLIIIARAILKELNP